MMLQDEILTLLRSGGGAYLSGEAMSRKLGVSRAAVWKAVDALRREGYAISSGSNRGYRLESAPDTLRAGELSQALAGRPAPDGAAGGWSNRAPCPSGTERRFPGGRGRRSAHR